MDVVPLSAADKAEQEAAAKRHQDWAALHRQDTATFTKLKKKMTARREAAAARRAAQSPNRAAAAAEGAAEVTDDRAGDLGGAGPRDRGVSGGADAAAVRKAYDDVKGMLKGLALGARAASGRRPPHAPTSVRGAWDARKGSALWADLGLGELKDDVGGGAGALDHRTDRYGPALHFAPEESVSRGRHDGAVSKNAQAGLLLTVFFTHLFVSTHTWAHISDEMLAFLDYANVTML